VCSPVLHRRGIFLIRHISNIFPLALELI
jgi:hypothetical protein